MAVVAVFMAIAVFAMPQGICLKTIMSDAQCCSTKRTVAENPRSDNVKPCCKAHASQSARQDDSAPASENELCMWTSTDPYLLASLDLSDVVVVNLAALPWDSLFVADIPAPVLPADSVLTTLTSPALRRGSSILRI